MSSFLVKFYNNIFAEGSFPESRGEGIIIPIFNHEPNNFRGITLNNILSKIYSKLSVTRLTKWSEENEEIINNQYGFQKRKSTVDCVFILQNTIQKLIK